MENASKALIMAGGMLLAILIISLLVYAWSLFSKYQASKDSLADIEDTAKFNEQFANYDRDDVQGYELLSLVNKVIDYNNRKTNAEGAKSTEKYTPMAIVINMSDDRKMLAKEEENKLFTSATYMQSNTTNTFGAILSEMNNIESGYGGADAATKIAKSFDSIFLSDGQIDSEINKGRNYNDIIKEAGKIFNSYYRTGNVKYDTSFRYSNEYIKHRNNFLKYYEYVQFKKAKFQSQSNMIKYDEVTGRIISMTFNFTGKLN